MDLSHEQILNFSNAGFGWNDTPTLTEIDLRLEPGGFYFLTGPSGSGKTTFLRMCYLDLMPTFGELTVFGKSADTLDRDGIAKTRRRIGVMHQDCKFLDHLSLRENILLPLSVSGQKNLKNNSHVDQLLNWVGLTSREFALPPELSGGEKQRAALARAVVASPELILCDEPTGNVDWEMSERILALLIQLNRSGRTIVLATHDLPLIRSAKSQIKTRVLRLSKGKIKLAGSDL